MDVQKTLRALYQEKKHLDSVISSLEKRARAKAANSSRGRPHRRGMSAEQRRNASLRMKRYWEARRAQAPVSAETANSAAASAGDSISA